MKTRGNYSIVVMVLTVSLLYGYNQANQKEPPKRDLQIVSSDEPIQWETNEMGKLYYKEFDTGLKEVKKSHVIGKEIGVIEPKYMASFMIRDHRGEKEKDYLLANYDRKFEELARQSMSKRQNIFLTQRASSHMAYTSSGIFVEYKLYAVTEEDARKMAETTLEWLDDKAYAPIQKYKNENENLKSELGKAKERISQIRKSIESYNKIKEASRIIFPVKDKLGFAVNYDNLPSADIQNRVLEYHNMLNMLEIDIAGHEAKIKTLRDYMGKGELQTQSRTHQMLIQAEVELAGDMARRQAIITSAKIMNSYLDAIQNIQKLEKERKTLTGKIARLQADLQKSEETLSNPPGHMRPVEVFMNRITIHPVRKGEDK